MNAWQSGSARRPRIGRKRWHNRLRSLSSMLEEAAADGGLLMRLPHIEEIAHDAGNILPAADVLGAALFVQPEGLLVEGGVVARFTQMIPGLTGELGQHFDHPFLPGLHPGDVLVAQLESFEHLGGEHLQFGFENMRAQVQQFLQPVEVGGERLRYRWGFIGIFGNSVHALGSFCSVILERNTPTPCRASRQYASVDDRQNRFKITVLQGENGQPIKDCLVVGEKELQLAPRKCTEASLEVSMGYDASGMVTVLVRDLISGKTEDITVRFFDQH